MFSGLASFSIPADVLDVVQVGPQQKGESFSFTIIQLRNTGIEALSLTLNYLDLSQ